MLSQALAAGNVNLLKQAARFAENRQEVLAGNIANIDTPGYKMRDLPVDSFRAALATAMEFERGQRPTSSSPGLTLSNPGSTVQPIQQVSDLFPDQLFEAIDPERQPGITFQDAGNRSIESQMLGMTKNAVYQNFALELLRLQYDQLSSAISEQA